MYVVKSSSTDRKSNQAALTTRCMQLRIAFNTQEGSYLISWQEIERCEADSNYTRIFLRDGSTMIISKTLSRIEEVLPSMHFVRIHQSHLVAIEQIRCIGKDNVRLRNETILPVSRKKRKDLNQSIISITNQI